VLRGQGRKDETSMDRQPQRPRARQLAIVVCAWLTIVAGAESASAATALAGAQAPDFVLKSVDGENLRLSEYRGLVVLVSFWATWCGDCRAQLTELNHWHGTYEAAGLRLLAVGIDRELSDVRDTVTSLGLEFPVMHDAGLEVSQRYSVIEMPAAVLIDRDGIVREVFEGFRRSHGQAMLDRVRDLLRE
jgi:peroxiredoxin